MQKSNSKGLKILAFSWNTQSIRLSESLDEKINQEHRTRKDWTLKSEYLFEAKIADFLPELITKIKKEDIDIVAIGFQEDAEPGSYFHSHLLKEIMPLNGYNLIKRGKLMGIGITTYKSMKGGDIKLRGLRMSIYAKESLLKKENNKSYWDYYFNEYDAETLLFSGSQYTRSKGSLGIYLDIPYIGTILFINSHFPFESERLKERQKINDDYYNKEKLQIQNNAFNLTYRSFILHPPNNRPTPNYIIWMGDLNYRLNICDAKSIVNDLYSLSDSDLILYLSNLYYSHDELFQQFSLDLIYPFSEGVSNNGPLFLPTCKMLHSRSSVRYKLGKSFQRPPSWSDRILYKSLNSPSLICLSYDRWTTGKTMLLSDHDAVIGTFFLPFNYDYSLLTD